MYEFYITPEEYEIAERNGISKNTLEERVRDYGWSKQRAITQPVQPRRDYGEWRDIAAKNGICYRTFYKRVNVLKWDMKKAATLLPQDNATILLRTREARQIIPQELIDKARSNGIRQDTLYHRITRGWDTEKATTLTPIKTGRRSKVS